MSTFNDMVDFIKSAWPGRGFIVPCLEGSSGIGKTAAVRQAAIELGAGKVVTIIASQILPNEVSGITMPVAESKAMEIFDHYRLSSLEDGDVLFFDELLEADQLVLSACLTLIESRELMSGRKLPDILIVAATNPTIKAEMLKENIRQRFVWRKFDLDREGCRNFIKKSCGFDPGESVVSKIVESGKEYNILTQRSLTKMCQWIASASSPGEVREIARNIDCCWHSMLGSNIADAYLQRMNDPEMQVRHAIRVALEETGADLDATDEMFENSSMSEVMEVLQKLPEWEQVERLLSSMMLEEEKEEEIAF